jgi:signal transduction histidine kinase
MQMFEMAIGNCDRLVRLVNDILDFDSVEKGMLALNRKPVKADDLLRQAAAAVHGPASASRISFQIDATEERVLADGDRVLKVLHELLTNAVKFSPPDTQIRLSAKSLEPANATSGEVCFVVEDQGRGIAPDKLEKIFDKFHQGDASDTRSRGGTGLGLALCRSIIEQHSGRIWAESTKDKGSRFLFTLPMAIENTGSIA